MLAQDLPHKLIAVEAKCSTRQVGRIKANIILHGSVRPPKVVHQGPKYKVTTEMEDVHILGAVCHDHTECRRSASFSAYDPTSTWMKWFIFSGIPLV